MGLVAHAQGGLVSAARAFVDVDFDSVQRVGEPAQSLPKFRNACNQRVAIRIVTQHRDELLFELLCLAARKAGNINLYAIRHVAMHTRNLTPSAECR